MTRGVWLLVLCLCLFAIAVLIAGDAHAQNEQTGDLNTSNVNSTVSSNNPSTSTTNNYNGAGAASNVTPPPTAVSPSAPSGGSESCLIGRGMGVQVNVLGLSMGGYKQDEECNRRRGRKSTKRTRYVNRGCSSTLSVNRYMESYVRFWDSVSYGS